VKAWHKRLVVIIFMASVISTGAFLIVDSLRDNIIYFYTPSEIEDDKSLICNDLIKVGGVVKEGSIKELANGGLEFIVTDFKNDIVIQYTGMLPGLFKEGQGAIATGKFVDNVFVAYELLAKHDERYIPKEIYEMKKGKIE
jgi:cytochrome c-type biogenesis protein CcmE